MMNSIELRSPFLSKDIFKLSNSLPDTFFFKNGYPKAVLREAMKSIMPKKIIKNLNKVGFYISFFDFFLKKEIIEIKKIINNSKILEKLLKKIKSKIF